MLLAQKSSVCLVTEAFGKYASLLLLLSLFALLLLRLLLGLGPPKASELQKVCRVVTDVVEVFHGCWAEGLHFWGFGTSGTGFDSLLSRPGPVGLGLGWL